MEHKNHRSLLAILFFAFGGIALIHGIYSQITSTTWEGIQIMLPGYVVCAVSFCIGILVRAGRRSILMPILLLCQGILPFIFDFSLRKNLIPFVLMYLVPIAYDLIYTIDADVFTNPEGLRKKCSTFYFVPSISSLVFFVIMIVKMISYNTIWSLVLFSISDYILSYLFCILTPFFVAKWLTEPYRVKVAPLSPVVEESENVQ